MLFIYKAAQPFIINDGRQSNIRYKGEIIKINLVLAEKRW